MTWNGIKSCSPGDDIQKGLKYSFSQAASKRGYEGTWVDSQKANVTASRYPKTIGAQHINHNTRTNVCIRDSSTDVQDCRVRDDVGLHGVCPAVCIREDDAGGGPKSERLEGQVRLPARVDHERLLQPAEAVQHDEGGREPRLEGLRSRHAARL